MDETTIPAPVADAPVADAAAPAPAPAPASDTPAVAPDAPAAPAPAPAAPVLFYAYDPATLIYVGAPGMADQDPQDATNVLWPAFSTLVPAPAAIPEGQVAVFDEGQQVWNLASISIFQQPQPQSPAPSLDQLKDAAQASVDAHFEALYSMAVPSASIAREYDCAYWSAKAWLDAGMPDPVPARVQALADTTSTEEAPVTAQQAAELVVLKWLEAESVMDGRGAARLRAKAAIRAAADQAGVFAAEADGKASMEAITYTI